MHTVIPKGVIDTAGEIKDTFPWLGSNCRKYCYSPSSQFALQWQEQMQLKWALDLRSIMHHWIIAGVGDSHSFLQFSNCAEQMYSIEAFLLIADGGVRYSGDLVRLCSRWSFNYDRVHCLEVLREAPGANDHLQRERKLSPYRGMGFGWKLWGIRAPKDGYFQDVSNVKKLVPEGIVGAVPFKGLVSRSTLQFW